MARWTLPFFVPLVACNPTLTLQGPATDAGAPEGDASLMPETRPMGRDAGAPTSADAAKGDDAGRTATDAAGATDTHQDDASPGQSCPPSAQQGTATVLANGAPPYGTFFDDVWFWQNTMYALAPPWSVVTAAVPGGSPQVTNFTEGLPSFIAGAVGAAQPSGLGAVTAQNILPLSMNGATFYGLRGPSGWDGWRPGDVVVDGADLFFWTASPAQLVHANLATSTDTVVAQYADGSNEMVTAMALTSSLLYFTSAVGSGNSLSSATLYSAPRSGGPVSTVASLPQLTGAQEPDGILLDGATAYITQRSPIGATSDMVWVVDLASGAATTAQMPMGTGSQQYAGRSTNVAFDGTNLYWGQGTTACNGALMRASKTAFTTNAPADTLMTGTEPPLSVGASGGAVYVGTFGDQTQTPASPPQVLVWKP